jgi:hypothetical protein
MPHLEKLLAQRAQEEVRRFLPQCPEFTAMQERLVIAEQRVAEQDRVLEELLRESGEVDREMKLLLIECKMRLEQLEGTVTKILQYSAELEFRLESINYAFKSNAI